MVDTVKKRRIHKKDWDTVAEFVTNELKTRRNQPFRTQHEAIWKEVDRQIAMKPMTRLSKGDEDDWRSVLELGELAKASEIITADVMRLTFPTTRAWFDAHSELPAKLTEQGEKEVDQEEQEFTDRALRAFMVQQHNDFGMKARYELSVKEALHHGSYVAEIVFENRTMFRGDKVQPFGAPVWKPYSMWNAYPDPSPSTIGTDLFYTGAMILVDFIPLEKLKASAKGEGWMADNISKIKTRKNTNKDNETEDIELVKYKGDITIKRQDGDIFLPNSEVLIANDVIVFYKSADLPYPNVIFSGYERMDVRDPYYTSPLIKLSPTQKLASNLANKFIDNVWLKIEPPIVYDGNDPQLVMDGGPRISPGARVASKGNSDFKEVQIGDPSAALAGFEMMLSQMNEGLGINAIRAGAGGDNSDKTATEIDTTEAKGEIRTSEFVDKQERHALRPFLVMQHALNQLHLGQYTFYNPEKDSPDFMRVNKSQLPKNVQFEIVGSKGVLGEQRRARGMSEVTAYLSTNPHTENLPKYPDIAKQMYQDAGVKNPERFLNTPEGNPEVEAIQQQAEQAIQEIQAKMEELEKELAITKAVNDARVEESKTVAQIRGQQKLTEAKLEVAVEEEKLKIKREEAGVKTKLERDKFLVSQDRLDADGNEIDELDEMKKVADELKISIDKFSAAQSAPKEVIRDENGFIKEIRPKLDS